MRKRRKIALFGGSFDPIHNGHLALMERALGGLGLDQIILLPCRQSPHKEHAPAVSDEHRVKMCQLATEHLAGVQVSEVEIQRNPPSFSWMTVEHFSAKFPEDSLYWIMGTDQWNNLEKWARPDYLMRTLHFIVAERQSPITPKPQATFTPLHLDLHISSTAIRKKLESSGFSDHLPEKVSQYIMANSLYEGKRRR